MGKSLLLLLSPLLLAATSLRADEHTASSWDEIDALAARLMAVARVIGHEHYDPPPRQELVYRLTQRLAAHSDTVMPPGLGRELSSLNDDAALEAELVAFCRELIQRQPTNIDAHKVYAVERSVIRDVLQSLPGPNFVRTRKEHLVEEQFANNRYVGIGIAISLTKEPRLPRMHHLFENGPAENAGAKKGDLIVEIDGTPTERMGLDKVIDRLRGPAGSAVILKLRQPDEDEARELTITRGVVPMKHTTLEGGNGSNTIKFSRITAATVQELREIEEQLDDATEEIVLEIPHANEVRSAFDLHQAVMLADALLDGGEVGRARTADGVREFSASRDCLFRDRPLKVRVSENTSGPLEWVVAALQDNDRATIVGQRTAGAPFITDDYEVPGTEWVLQLTYGVLERADGRSLMRTQSSPRSNRPHVVIVRSKDEKRVPVVGPVARDEHDGGVVPDQLTDPPSGRVKIDATGREIGDATEASKDVLEALKQWLLRWRRDSE